ncbi:hypothetical protein [Streptomyces sp. NBC_00009]|uniref:hypothetical protein n=1 Tax=Streptomyces sp. NBC_00009 TaxID=2975620 RepID=UPI003247362A
MIYEYLPHELARLGVLSKASGLDRGRVATQVRLAQERAGDAVMAPAEPHHLSELFIAELRRLQWERIAGLMELEGMPVYVASRDVRAVRYEEQRLQRLMEEVTEAERSGVAAPEIARHRVFRIYARPSGGASRLNMPAPVVHLMASSAAEAALRAWAVHGGKDGLYERREHRIASAEQVLPEPGELF